MRKNTIILTTLLVLSIINITSAQVILNPRSVGMAGTFATQARGDEVIGWNPANLAYDDNPNFGLSFGILPLVPFPNLQVNNDLLTVNWFNEWFTKGDYLDADDVSDLLGTFPKDGVNFYPLTSMKFIGMNFGSFAVSVGLEFQTSVSIPKGIFEFVLTGNQFGEPVDLSNMSMQFQSVFPISFAYGTQLSIPGLEEFVQASYVGAAVKFLVGAAYAETEEFSGSITTHKDKIHAIGDITGKAAIGGFGTAFDVGAAADLTNDMRVNISINNLIGFVNWSDSNTERFEVSFDGEVFSSEFEDLSDYSDEQMDSVFNVIDTSFAISGFSTKYPTYMLIGFEYRNLLPQLNVYANYRQDLSTEYSFDTTPRISGGVEYNAIPWLPLRAGLALGGLESFQWGIGWGLKFEHYTLDIGFSQDRGIFNGAHGFSFSIGQQLLF